MKITISINGLDAGKILEDRGLGKDNQAALKLAMVVRRFCDPYVPFQQGTLKNTVHIGCDSDGAYIIYNQPYAHYQYTGVVYGPNFLTKDGWRSMAPKGGKKPTNRTLAYNQAPMRGKEWDRRMMADRGDEVLACAAQIIGGEVV